MRGSCRLDSNTSKNKDEKLVDIIKENVSNYILRKVDREIEQLIRLKENINNSHTNTYNCDYHNYSSSTTNHSHHNEYHSNQQHSYHYPYYQHDNWSYYHHYYPDYNDYQEPRDNSNLITVQLEQETDKVNRKNINHSKRAKIQQAPLYITNISTYSHSTKSVHIRPNKDDTRFVEGQLIYYTDQSSTQKAKSDYFLYNNSAVDSREFLNILSFKCKNVNTCGILFNDVNKIADICLLQHVQETCYITPLPDGNERIQCIEIRGAESRLVISVYLPCKESTGSIEELQECIDLLNEIYATYKETHNILLGGDLNENAIHFTNSKRSKYLQEFMKEHNLVTKDLDPTFIHPNGYDSTCIDFFLYSKKYSSSIIKIIKLEDIPGNISDHYPIDSVARLKYNHLELMHNKDNKRICPTLKTNWDKIDTEQYKN
ncbi:unnamed protein product [Mytilus coruscus]|uniref:Endonuclease/exonuclease/phosphatase domain-containing protein n=1 Tax=Mytilus coruscus TaxID=42192 RepID=A0A6J8EK52_MYTCO|nr:unnamed protein product [Mytilus coruscus]